MTKQPERAWKFVLAATAIGLLAAPGAAAQPPAPQPPAVQPAIDSILDAFKGHPLVGIGDKHGLAQEQDFYAALIRDPRFAREVGNVVVEFGASTHQDIIDRYTAGEAVSYAELRKVWADAVGWTTEGASWLGIANFYAQVRATNLALPTDKRIRIWLGEPPIDWPKVTKKEDVEPFKAQRDSHPAELIEKNILSKNKKALVIYGHAHLFNGDPAYLGERRALASPGSETALRKLLTGYVRSAPAYDAMTSVEAARVKAAFARGVPVEATLINFETLGPVTSIVFKESYDDPEKGFVRDVYDVTFAAGQRPNPVLTRRYVVVLDAHGKVDRVFLRPPFSRPPGAKLVDLVEQQHPNAFFAVQPYTGSMDYMVTYPRPARKVCDESFEQGVKDWAAPALVPLSALPQTRDLCDLRSGIDSSVDAILYLGPTSSLTFSPKTPDLWLDPDRIAEANRRSQIIYGRSYLPSPEAYPVSPVKLE